jgi:hypothetical protein
MKWLMMPVTAALSAVVSMHALAAGDAAPGGTPVLIAQGTQQDLKGMEQSGQRDDMTTMTPAQQDQYRSQYQSAKARWATMTPQQRSAMLASAREKKLKDLSVIELVGQRDDMKREIAAQSDELKKQAAAAKSQWDRMTPAQKQAARKSAWAKKRAELDGIEQAGQRDDTYVLPW